MKKLIQTLSIGIALVLGGALSIGAVNLDLNTVLTTVTLKDHTGTPIADRARVDLMRPNGSGTGVKAFTDEGPVMGRADFEVLPGFDHSFKVQYNGLYTVTNIVPDNAQVEIQTQLSQLVLKDQNDNGIPDVKVYMLRPDESNTGQWDKTDVNGVVGFETFAGCNVKFRIDFRGESFVTDLMPCGRVHTLNLAVEAPVVTLNLLDSQGNHLSGARVYLRTDDDKGTSAPRVDTDGSGSIKFDVLPSATHRFRVTYNGETITTDAVTSGGEITVQTASTKLLLVDSDNNPINDAKVYLRKVDGKSTGVGVIRTGEQEVNGQVAYDVLPNVLHRFLIEYNGGNYTFPKLEDPALALSAGAVEPTAEVATRKTELVLVESDGATKIAGAKVYLRKDDGNSTGVGAVITTVAEGEEAPSAQDGVATFQVLPNVGHRFLVQYNGGSYTFPELEADALTLNETASSQVSVSTRATSLNLLASDNAPIDDAKVYLRKDDGKSTGVANIKTGSQGTAGQVTFEVLPTVGHQFLIQFNGGDYTYPASAIVIPAGGAANVVSLNTVSTQLVVKNAGGDLEDDVKVYLRKGDGKSTGVAYIKTGAQGTTGQVAFEVLPDFAHRFQIRTSGTHTFPALEPTEDPAIVIESGQSSIVEFTTPVASKIALSKPVAGNVEDAEVAYSFGLGQNYPNPFNPATAISYTLPGSANVSLIVYNVLGQQVKTLVNDFQASGAYTVRWDGLDALNRQVATGTYIYRLIANDQVALKKMTFAK